MAYNPFGEETEVEDFSNKQATDEERKKRLARMAMLVTGQAGLGDTAGQMLGERLAPIQSAITDPQAALEQRFGVPVQQPQAPVQPQPVQQPAAVQQPAVQQPVAPVSPEQVQLPEPGPATQVAGPTQITPQPVAQVQAQPQQQVQQTPPVPQQAEVSKPAMNDVFHDAFIAARNSQDPKERRSAYAQLIGNPQVPEGIKAQANLAFVEDYQNQRAKQEAMQKLEKATPNELARYMQEKGKDEGSYLKAILFHRLGLNELAQQEQEKLSPSLKAASVTDSTTGQRYTAYRNKAGEITKAFDTEGNQADQAALSRLSAATLPTQAHQLPAVHGSPVQRTNDKGQVETGLMMYDPQSQSSYVQVGNSRLPTTGWSTMAQNVNNVFGAAQARTAGEGAGKGFTPQPLQQFPGQVGQAPAPAAVQQPMPQAQAQPQVQRPAPVNPATMGQVPAAPAPVAQTQPTQAAPAATGGGQAQPGTPLYVQQRQNELTTEAGKANIQLKKEVAAAEQKVPAEAKGKTQAKDIQNQYFANETYGLIKPLADEIKKSTGSGIGTSVDKLASVFGAGTTGAQAIAKLDVLGYQLSSNVPRFEGSQSDADVKLYQQAAGDLANSNKPVSVRLAALQAITQVLKKYDKEGKNDWSFGESKPAGAGTTSSGNKYKRVE